MKFTKYNKEGLAKLEHFICTGAVDDIEIRQASNSLRIYCRGRTRHAGSFNFEVGRGPEGSSRLAVLGHEIAAHEESATKNV